MSAFDIRVVRFGDDDYTQLLEEGGWEVVDSNADLRTLRRAKRVPLVVAKLND